MRSGSRYIALSEDCVLRRLETPCVYNRQTDELYELGEEAGGFLRRCDGTRTPEELDGDPEFLEYCFSEGILTAFDRPTPRHIGEGQAPPVSLRYIEFQITSRCNLRCRHCYIDVIGRRDMETMGVVRVMDEFDKLQGLRLLISGGEPLMHSDFWGINERLPEYGFRSVLMTNGTMVDAVAASRLNVQEAQVSLDGMRVAHDIIRGTGAFDKALMGIEGLLNAGKKVSVATMVTAINRQDFDEMARLMESLGVHEWNVDAPSLTGRFRNNPGLLLHPAQSARYLEYGFGGGLHEGHAVYTCGAHLCAVGPSGQVAKCGFYLDSPVGHMSEGLATCWGRLAPTPVGTLECDCEYIEQCRGGCRFRAETYTGENGPDPVKCAGFGVDQRDNRCNLKGGGGYDYKEGGEGLGERL